MGLLLVTGKGRNGFAQKLKELDGKIDFLEGIIMNIPEDSNIDIQKYMNMLNSLSPDEEVQITRLQ